MKRKLFLLLSAFSFVSNAQEFAQMPYNYGFESGTEQWTIVNAGQGTSNWEFAGSGFFDITAAEGNKFAAYTFSNAQANAWLMSDKIELQAGHTYSISFKYRGLANVLTEGIKVYIGSDNTVAAQLAGTQLLRNEQIHHTAWQTATLNFTPGTSDFYVIGFNACSPAFQGVLALDDLRINDTSLGFDDVNENNFSIYPNPVTDVLNVKSADGKTFTQITAFDFTGRTIHNAAFDSLSDVSIDTSMWSAGTYLMNITSENGTANYRIVKQ